ncbi:smoothened-like protein [Caerostris extrusa]|uniref:Smoothened-like protein n=1 Tax=Caerostris extrusa TaxID=172846 RepID=A0AAV4T5Y1_CAEEX|nr:smoothened-like protein [Caerostris extrusa]
MPKCENGSVFLPSQEMCRITRGPCKVVETTESWPSFLRCENKNLFPPRCKNPLQEIKFNTSYKCIRPLVETDNSEICMTMLKVVEFSVKILSTAVRSMNILII